MIALYGLWQAIKAVGALAGRRRDADGPGLVAVLILRKATA